MLISGGEDGIGFEIVDKLRMERDGAVLLVFAVDGKIAGLEVEVGFGDSLDELGAPDAGPFDDVAGKRNLAMRKILKKLIQLVGHEEVGERFVNFKFGDLDVVQD